MERPHISLDGAWHFWTDPDATLTHASLDAAGARPMTVPGPWQATVGSVHSRLIGSPLMAGTEFN